MHNYPVSESTLLVDSPIIAVRRDHVRMPGGHIAAREIVEHFGAVAIVAYDDVTGSIALVRQWRQAVGARLWEIPAGLLDVAGESNLRAAQRELREEAGLMASKWSLLLDLVTSPGFCDEAVRIYLARDLSTVARPVGEDDEESELELRWVTLDDARAMVFSGQVVNSIAISAILAASEVVAGRALARDTATPFDFCPRALAQRRQAGGAGADLKQS